LWLLDISHNQLVDLPGSFSLLEGLLDLDASDNQLSSLPQPFAPNVQSLILKRNNFSKIPPESENWSLFELDMRHNKLTGIIPSFIANLTIFDLSENQLIGSDMKFPTDWNGECDLYDNPFNCSLFVDYEQWLDACDGICT